MGHSSPLFSAKELRDAFKKQNRRLTFLSVMICLITFLFTRFGGKWLDNKADVWTAAQYTQIVDTVNARIQRLQDIDKQNRELKYNALLKSLNLIDAYYSNKYIDIDGVKPQKQFATIEEWRECNNQLVLTCSKQTVEAFLQLILNKNAKNEPAGAAMMRLYKYRNLVRKELEFDQFTNDTTKLDSNYIWLGSVITSKSK